MKNIFRFLMAVAVLFTASCAKEDISSSIGGGEVEVTFSANLADLGTRAYGEGAHANTLQFFVYQYADENSVGEFLPNVLVYTGDQGSNVITKTSGNKFDFSLTLVKGMRYNILFWADKGNNNTPDDTTDDSIYSVDSATGVVTADYDGVLANNETLDAFFGKLEDFDPATDAAEAKEITLKRPFAQLNAYTNDLAIVEQSGKQLDKSSLTVNTYTTLNLFNGDVYDAQKQDVTFNLAGIPAGDHISMNYLLAPVEKCTANVTFDYTFTDETIDFPATTYTFVPLKRNYRTNIIGKLLTAATDFSVEIKPAFDTPSDNIVPVASAAELQEALDNAVPNTEIRLAPGVNYGTILIRPVAGAANTITDCDYLVYRNEMLRKVENLTIVGAEGAKVEAFKVVAGYIEGSTGYVVDIKNLVIDGVEFNDTYTNAPHSYAAPIFFDLTYTNVDGLTVKNCKLIGDNSKMNFVYLYGSGKPSNSTFETAAKNITISNNIVDGIARLCELRQANNVTITGNTIKNTALHGMLLSVDGGTYSGNVTITENKAYNIGDRFVRMAGAGDAIVEITNNNIYNYGGEDADFIKVTDGNEDNITIENNNLVTEVASWDEFTAVTDNSYVLLIENISTDKSYTLTKNLTIDLNGKTLEISGATNRLNLGNKNQASAPKPNVTIKNGNLNGKVYVQTGNTTLSDIKFGGSIAYTGDAQGVITVGSANLLAERCDMANVKANAAETRPRALSTEGNSNGYLRLIGCNFPSDGDKTTMFNKTKLLRTYINPLSGNAELEITNCKFGVACNIDLTASYVWSNMNLTGCSGGFTFTISRSKDSVTEEETSIMKAIKKNNSGTIKAYYNGTLVEY